MTKRSSSAATTGERVVGLEVWAKGHAEECARRQSRLEKDTAELKTLLNQFSADMKAGLGRLHVRIDATETKLDTVDTTVAANKNSADKKVLDTRIWMLTGALVLVLGIAGTLIVDGRPWDKAAAKRQSD